MNVRIGDLFAGIGGFSLGFRRAGFDVAWQVEIDPYCRKVLAKNFPEAERFNDVRECGAANLERVDVICGGFPCQDISYAGLGAGIEGERSGLWREYARIIGELRPRFAVVENVPALLARGLGRVLGDLAEIGYDAEWEVISAADAGAPHLRERVWILTYPAITEAQSRHGEVQAGAVENEALRLGDVRSHVADTSSEGLPQRELLPGVSADASRADAREAVVMGGSLFHSAGRGEQPRGAQRDERRLQNQTLRSVGDYHDWKTEPNVGRVADGVPSRVDRLRALGNAVVPQIPEWIANQILQLEATA